MPLASHISLPSRYRVVRHIASGGMATVWEVEDRELGRTVAVKVLARGYALDEGARARFQREARTAARVSGHPHIATIYDIGEHDEDAFIVMELFAGGTVADRLRAARESGDPVPQATALRWLGEAAAALDAAHEAGIVHRDVKPANLLLDARDRLAVGDFGIARLADDTHMTQTGQVLGTAAYLSPEQALGRPATDASDRYALAVVAYELLTGRRPFAGGPPSAQARQHAELEPARPSLAAPGLGPAVDALFARALAKDPARRPATARALVAELEDALAEPTVADDTPPTRRHVIAPLPPPAAAAAPDDAPPLPARRPRRGSPLAIIAIAAVVAGIVLAVALASGDDPPQTAGSSPTTARTSSGERTTTQARPAQPPPAATRPPPARATNPAALNAQGDALIKAGRYGEAVAPLQAAVDAYRRAGDTSGLPYAYALYNLGVALNRSGDPAAAVPILRERLEFDDQRSTVLAELNDALRKLGEEPVGDAGDDQGEAGNGKAKGKAKKSGD